MASSLPQGHAEPGRSRQAQRLADKAVKRFAERRAGEHRPQDCEEFRGKLVAFRNLYAFLSQIIPYGDSDLEKLYTFVRFLIPKLPRRTSGPQYHFDDKVALKYYRLQKISEGGIALQPDQPGLLDPTTEVGSAVVSDEKVALSTLVELINQRFGTSFTEADELFFSQSAKRPPPTSSSSRRPPPTPWRATRSSSTRPLRVCSSAVWSKTRRSPPSSKTTRSSAAR